MKIKKSLVTLTTASAVALSGSAVAVADEVKPADTAATQEGSLAGSSSNNAEGSSINDLFGWKDKGDLDAKGEPAEPTNLLKKITDMATLFSATVGIVGTAATLMTTLDKFIK